jgi:hypothetical protein
MLQRSVAVQSTPAAHAAPLVQVTSQKLPPHRSVEFVHAFEPSQRTLHPAAAEQSTPVWQALPPTHEMSHVWFAGHTAAQFWVHEMTHQPPASHAPFAAAHAVLSQKNGPASGGGAPVASGSASASTSASLRPPEAPA